MKKQFKVWQAVIFVLGIVLGGGAFYSANLITNSTHNPWLSVLVIGIGGFIVFALAQCFKEINSGFEGNAFMPVWMRGLVGRPLGSYLSISLSIKASPFVATFMAYLFAQYLIPVFFSHNSAFLANGHINVLGHLDFVAFLAIGAVAFFSIIHIFSFHFGKWFQIIGTIIKLIPLVGIIVIGFAMSNHSGFWNNPFKFDASVSHASVGTWLKALSLGTVASFLTFEGFYYAMRLGKNIEDSKRNVGRVMIISVSILIAIFVLLIYAMLQINLTGNVSFTKPWLTRTLYLFLALTGLVALNATTYTGARIFKTLQLNHLLPKFIDFTKDNHNNMPIKSAVAMLILNLIWSVTLFTILVTTRYNFFNSLITGMTSIFYFWFGVIAFSALINRFTKRIKTEVRVKGLAFWATCAFSMCVLLTGYKIFKLYTNANQMPFWTLIVANASVFSLWLVLELGWGYYREKIYLAKIKYQTKQLALSEIKK